MRGLRLLLVVGAVVGLAGCDPGQEEKPEEENEPPSAPETSLSPDTPTTLDDLQVHIISDAVDPNGDAITYRYVWIRDGAPIENDSDVLSAELTAKGEQWSVTVYATDGELESEGVEKSATILNSNPSITVSIEPTAPTTEDELSVSVEGSDPDGDELTLSYAWFKDGSEIGFTEAIVAPSATTKGETWSVQVTANDGELDSETAEATISIQNSLPTVTDVLIGPDPVYEGDSIAVTSTTLDADGDGVTLAYAWMVDGTLVQSGDQSLLTSDLFSKGQDVSVNVTPNDGADDGASVSSNSLAVANTPPVFTNISLDPSAVYTDSTLSCLPTGWYDADGDAEGYSYGWTVDGTSVGTTNSLAASFFVKGNVVVCSATANDGEEDGTSMSANSTVLNSAPTSSVPSITPTTAYAATDLVCTPGTSSDADGDTVTDIYSWTVDGSLASGATGQVLPGGGGFFVGGNSVQCHITPNDGTTDGAVASSNTVTVSNSAPVISQAQIVTQRGDQSVYTDDVLSVVITATDDDGDSISFDYQWMSGSLSLSTGSTLDGAFFDYGEQVSVTVTPDDGIVSGASVTSTAVTVLNSPPSSPSIEITPSPALLGVDDLTCSVISVSTDADGDPVQYYFDWIDPNGSVVQSVGPTSALSDVLSASSTYGGNWDCEVTPTDGLDDGQVASLSVQDARRSISAGQFHTCQLDEDYNVQCWGQDTYGQVSNVPSGTFLSVDAQGEFTCGVTSNGSVECWGRDDYGQISNTPSGTFENVSTGYYHGCGLETDGSVSCWGRNSNGAASPPSGTFQSLDSNSGHSCGMRSNGQVECWGGNSHAQSSPPSTTFQSMTAGGYHGCGIKLDGSLECWGTGGGQASPPAGSFQSVSGGRNHTCGITSIGSVECWGVDTAGQVTNVPSGTFGSVSTGWHHSCGIRTDGSVECWGDDSDGQASPP